MAVSRRSVAIACVGIAAGLGPVPVMASAFVDLTYSGGRLFWPGGATPAACGRSGVRADKREGDGASPAGTFPLWCCYYRPDRLAAPRTGLSLIPLRPNDGWCDDSADLQYNRLVSLPYPASNEDMWHDDELYDLVVPTGYNMEFAGSRTRQRDLPARRHGRFPADRRLHRDRSRCAPGAAAAARPRQHSHDPVLTGRDRPG